MIFTHNKLKLFFPTMFIRKTSLLSLTIFYLSKAVCVKAVS